MRSSSAIPRTKGETLAFRTFKPHFGNQALKSGFIFVRLDRAAAEISPQLALELEEDPQHFGDGEDGLAARELEEQRLPLSAGTSSRASASRASTQAAMQAQEGIGGYADGDILFS